MSRGSECAAAAGASGTAFAPVCMRRSNACAGECGDFSMRRRPSRTASSPRRPNTCKERALLGPIHAELASEWLVHGRRSQAEQQIAVAVALRSDEVFAIDRHRLRRGGSRRGQTTCGARLVFAGAAGRDERRWLAAIPGHAARRARSGPSPSSPHLRLSRRPMPARGRLPGLSWRCQWLWSRQPPNRRMPRRAHRRAQRGS